MSQTAPFPKTIFGTSSLGNLFIELPTATKTALVKAAIDNSETQPIFDSAGKYGAGLALECLASSLTALSVAPNDIKISNKLGWKRVPLTTDEPTFEPGAWINLKHDAVQDISYQGILDCYQQGNELLGQYNASIVSIHDPDEYLAAAQNERDKEQRQQNIIDAYQALLNLKASGQVESIGVGAKNVSVIDFISDHIQLDWAMFACSLTPYVHKESTLLLLKKLDKQGVKIINSAVFNAGFLLGSDNLDYQKISHASHPDAFVWRDKFNAICKQFNVTPAEACVQFSFLFPEVVSVALNSSSPERVKSNLSLSEKIIPMRFWQALQNEKLIDLPIFNKA